jgi:hypothetical protein
VPYTSKDLRSQLTPAGATARAVGATVAPQYFEFAKLEPDEVSDHGTKSWYVRSQTCCVAFSLANAGDSLRRDDQPDEYMVLLPSAESSAVITANGEVHEVTGRAVVVVPPGKSEVAVQASGIVVRLFSNRAEDLLERCRNAEVYAEPDGNVAPFGPWPDPPDGERVRVYGLDGIEADEGRFGRLLRCSTIMVNYFYPDDAPRDPSLLSPHHHDDFEQISLQLEGDYVHHIRTPWTVNMADWRDDDHQPCSSPAVTIIPPPTVHTSQAVHHMRHLLVDIFCPPRRDFSERPGWVVNHDEYPMP